LTLVTNDPLVFDVTSVGQAAESKSVVVRNEGRTTLRGSCSVARPFFVGQPFGCTFELPPNEEVHIAVDFVPTRPQSFAELIEFSSNGGNATLPVTGSALDVPEPPVTPDAGAGAIWGVFVGLYDGNDGAVFRGWHADEDARDLRNAINTGLGVPLERLRLLVNTDDSGEANFPIFKDDVRSAIETTLGQMSEGDSLIIYLGAHGSSEGLQPVSLQPIFTLPLQYNYDGVPAERQDEITKSKGDELLALTADDLYDDDLAEWLRAAEEKNISLWVFVDSCYSGGFWGPALADNPDSGDVGDLSRRSRIGFIAAASETWLSRFSIRTGRGWLTTGLIDAFARDSSDRLKADENSDDKLSLGEIYTHASVKWWEWFVSEHSDELDTYLVGFGSFKFSTEFTSLRNASFQPVMYRSSDFASALGANPSGIDETSPLVAYSIEGRQGREGWYIGDVTVRWNVADAESSIIASSGCGAASITSDSGGQAFTCTATSAGGTSSQSVTIKRDATPPILTFGSLEPVANAAGWHKGSVEIPFTTEDATSGVASADPASPVVVTMQGEGIARTVTVTDVAGNSATFSTPPVNIDTTVPAISISSPGDGASYLRDGQLIAGYSCNDVGSGMARCVGTVTNGALVNTSAEGHFDFSVQAEDLAGNANSKAHFYSIVVRYSFGGFWSPVDNPPLVNAVKAGRAVPIKWSLMNGEGQYVSDLSTFRSLNSQPVACLNGAPMDAVEESLTSGTSGLRYDPESRQFTYNWKTSSAWAGTCRRLVLELSDGQRREAVFRLH
jgi:hypothetical protein